MTDNKTNGNALSNDITFAEVIALVDENKDKIGREGVVIQWGDGRIFAIIDLGDLDTESTYTLTCTITAESEGDE